jgi:hypothetical protein
MGILRRSRRVVTLETVANNPAIVESLGMKALRPLIAQLKMVKGVLRAAKGRR